MTNQLPDISGLNYREDCISAAREQEALKAVDGSPWLTSLRRRTQHYGYKYDYTRRTADPADYLGELPAWAADLLETFRAEKLAKHEFDQLIVNEYEPGQGIAAHVDCVPCFKDTIAVVSLGSGVEMQFSRPQTSRSASLYLRPRSLRVMQGEARYEWRHGIASRKNDVVAGTRTPRGRRVSLTFRGMRL